MNSNISTPPVFSNTIKIRDGSQIIIRPLCYEDKNAFQNMFDCLTAETKFLRYHYVKLKLTALEVEDYCKMDYHDKFVLMAEKDNCGKKEVVGLGRFDRIGSTKTAEISFLVDDKEQGKGICTILLKYLSQIARDKGINRFIGLLTYENTIMLNILKKYTTNLIQEVDGSDILVSFDI